MWYAEDRLVRIYVSPLSCNSAHLVDLRLARHQGPERVKLLYAFRSLKESGARITLGSDFPVESMNPLSGFYAAVTRVSPDGKSPHGPEGW